MKHFGLKTKDNFKGFLFKDNLVIFEYETKAELLSFLEGLSCVLDNPNIWGLWK